MASARQEHPDAKHRLTTRFRGAASVVTKGRCENLYHNLTRLRLFLRRPVGLNLRLRLLRARELDRFSVHREGGLVLERAALVENQPDAPEHDACGEKEGETQIGEGSESRRSRQLKHFRGETARRRARVGPRRGARCGRFERDKERRGARDALE